MHPVSEDPAAVEFGRFRILPRQRAVLADNRRVELGGRAFDLLMALIDAQGAVVSKQALIERVWPGRIVEEANLLIQMSVLRKVLAADSRLIRTVAGQGYQFTGEIRAVSEPGDPRAVMAVPEPLASLSHPPTNLPDSVPELIGRGAELGRILDLSASHRLVTLTGAGGIGKTRLSLEVARELLPKFADGIWVAELAPLSDPYLVPVTVASALGVEVTSSSTAPESVANALRSKQLMLVLDNCEHVLDAAARMVEVLLRVNPAVRVIATSREPLRAEGEWVYRVPTLAVPAEDGPDDDDPLRYGAVRLFAERARETGADIPSEARVTAAIVGICRRLDGIPLAIEFAATRVATLGIDGLATGLDDRFRVLTAGRRTALARHRTLRGTFDWSHELLSEPERVVLRRLAIFAGGFTLRDARAVAADDQVGATEIDAHVASLVAKSLAHAEVGGGMPRCRLLETTRAYALEKVVQAGEFDRLARRHAKRYLEIFEAEEATIGTRWLDHGPAEHRPVIDNVRAALDWAFSANGDATIGVALTAAAVPFWMHQSLMAECRGRVERALAAIAAGTRGDARHEMQLHVGLAISLMYIRGAGLSEIGAVGAKALEIAESLDNPEYRLRALFSLWSYSFNSARHRDALTLAQKFHALSVTRPDPIDRLIGERMIGSSLYYLGDLVSARRHLERVLAHPAAAARRSDIIRFEGDEWAQARAYLARTLWLQGLPDQAMQAAESSVADARATNHAVTIGLTMLGGACPIALWAGDLVAAERYVELLLIDSKRYVLPRWRVFGSCYQGMIAIRRGDVPTGLRLLRAAFGEPAAAGSAPRLFAFLISAASDHVAPIADGLPAIEEAITRIEHGEERWLAAEALRIRGELLLARGGPGAAPTAENYYRQAADLARQQGALSWELRAAMSLARLWRQQARGKEARALLAPVYDRFTEGFATSDLSAAKALIKEIS